MTAAYQAAVLALTPTAYWPMQDEAPGARDVVPGVGACSNTFVDVSGNGNTVTRSTTNNAVTGSPVSRWLIDGPMGGDVAVAGTGSENDWILNTSIVTGDVFSMACWARLSIVGAASPATIILMESAGLGAQMSLTVVGGANKLTLVKNGISYIVTQTGAGLSNPVTDLGWHFYACTKNAAVSSKLYIDGVDVTGVVTDATCGATGFSLASGIGAANSFNLPGAIAHAAWWAGTSLTLANIQSMYNAASAFHREEIKAAGGGRSENIVPVGTRRAVVKPNY